MNRRTSNFIYILTHHTTVGILAGLALLFALSLGGCTQRGGKTGVGDIYIWTPVGELLPQTSGPRPDLSTVPGPDNTVHVTDHVIRPKGL